MAFMVVILGLGLSFYILFLGFRYTKDEIPNLSKLNVAKTMVDPKSLTLNPNSGRSCSIQALLLKFPVSILLRGSPGSPMAIVGSQHVSNCGFRV